MIVTSDFSQTIFDVTSQNNYGGFTLLTWFSMFYFFFILFRDGLFVMLLLFAHKTISLALEFRIEMCAIDSMIILVLSACCGLLIPRNGQPSGEDK